MTTTVEFGELEDAVLQEAWPHEALSFTPWLAANLDRLSRAVGIELILEGTEVRVGPFAADVLARNALDQSLVLIENQLEQGDHKHLGQILTYLTGLEAQTVIWIARHFRDEHLSAIRWLNQHTADNFSFFAIRLRVVRIGASPFAPLFEIVERPNDWDRTVQEAAAETKEASPATLLWRSFWDRFGERFKVAGFGHGSPTSRWLPVPGTELVVSVWLGEERVGLFVRGGKGRGGAAVREDLLLQGDRLERGLGVPIGLPDFPYGNRTDADMTTESGMDASAEWLLAEARRYASVLTEIFGDQPNG